MKKYKLTLNIFGHKLDEDELKEAFELANQHKDTPYHEDYSQSGGEGYIDVIAELTHAGESGNDLKLEMTFSGEGKTFEEKSAEMKKMVESGELQRSLLYECESDIHDPKAPKKANKITATIVQIY